jgi:Ubiquinone biosynthesis protein COQ7
MQPERAGLVGLLRRAYSGELGAAIAYRGHAASLRDAAERRRVRRIRAEELDHRRRVGRLLRQLEARPSRLLEARNWCLGTSIGAFCRVGGWFLPMYGAGWIERRNIVEYEHAARLAAACDELVAADDLLAMAEVEWEHERFFRLRAASHWGSRVLKLWPAPGPKAAIRADFTAFRQAQTTRLAPVEALELAA